MIVKGLKLCGVKVFSEACYVELGEGVSLFYGENRAGKSSLLEGLVLAIFGLPRYKVKGLSKDLSKELIFSWTKPESFETEVTYSCDAGLFKIWRDLAKNKAAIYSMAGGADDFKLITHDKNVVAHKVAEHAGIKDLPIFLSTCCIRQGELSLIARNLEKVGQAVETILSGADGVDAPTVLSLLERRRLDLKPRDSRDVRTSNPREYERLTSDQDRLASELNDVRQKKERAESARVELAGLNESLPAFTRRRGELANLLDKYQEKSRLAEEADRLREESKKENVRIERVEKREEEIKRLEQKLSSIEGGDGLGKAEADDLREQLIRKEGADESLRTLHAEKEEISEKLQTLGKEANQDCKLASLIETAKTDFPFWERSKAEAAEIIAQKEADLEALNKEAAKKKSRTPSPAKLKAALFGALSLFAFLLLLVSAGLLGAYWWASAGAAGLALLAAYLFLQARRKRFDASEELFKIGICSDEIEGHKATICEWDEKMNGLLRELRLAHGDDLKRRCREFYERESKMARQRERLEETQRVIEQKSKEMEDVGLKISAILRGASCATGEAFFENFAEVENIRSEKERLQSEVRGQIEGSKIEELKSLRDDKLLELNSKEARLRCPEFSLFAPGAEEVERWSNELKELDSRIAASEKRKSELEGVLSELDLDRKSPEDLEERLNFVRGRLGEIDKLHEACSRAIDYLRRAIEEVRGEYLPELEKRLQSMFCSLADDEFTDVSLLDSWPNILLSTHSKSDVSRDSLSAGTIDQLFISLRLAAIGVISGGRRLPLILDDPLVNCDGRSKAAILNMIADVAKSHQVIFFTCHDEFREWARALKESLALDVKIFEIGADHGIVER